MNAMRFSLITEKTTRFAPDAKIIIYGAGNFGKEVCLRLQKRGFSPIAFLDRQAKPGDHWNDIRILPLDQRVFTEEQKRQMIVFVAVHNRDVDLQPIFQYLQGQNFGCVLNPVEFYDLIADQTESHYWLTSRLRYQDWRDEISTAAHLWEDEQSKVIYRTILNLRCNGDYTGLSLPKLDCQYFPTDIPSWNTPLRFVDCGAYDGDTYRLLKDRQIPVDTSVAFEPDLANFRKLSDYVSKNWESPAVLFPCGVFSETRKTQFVSDGGEGGKIEEKGENVVQVVAIDDVLVDFRPNLIKMDIEGAEVEALLGARRTIEKDHPGLAICVYHKPQHLWQIPLMIHGWNLGYKFYLREHAYNGFDLVMYAIAS